MARKKSTKFNALQLIEAAKVIGGAGSSDELRASYRILAAGSKDLQAALVSTYTQAEQELTKEIASLRDADLVTVHKQAALDRVKKILDKYKTKLGSLCRGLAKVGTIQGKVQGEIRNQTEAKRDNELKEAVAALEAFGLKKEASKTKKKVRMYLSLYSASNLFSLSMNINPQGQGFYHSPFYSKFSVEKGLFEDLIAGAYIELPSRRLIFRDSVQNKFVSQSGGEYDVLTLIEEMAARAIRKQIPNSTQPFELSKGDEENVQRILHNMLGKLTHTFDCAYENISNQINQASNRVRSVDPDELPQAQTISINTVTQAENDVYDESEKGLSASMRSHLISNPESAEKEILNDVEEHIKFMRTQYAIGRREQDVLRQKTLAEIAKAEAKGSGSRSACRGLIQSLMRDGIVAFEDRSGKRWTLSSYCEMTTRTGSRQAINIGELYSDADADLFYIVPRNSTCPICSKYEGRVYSRSGKNPNYPPLYKAFGKIDPNGDDSIENTYVSIHPNCRHALARWSETTKTQEEIAKIREQSNRSFDIDQRTQEQVNAQKERERQSGIYSRARTTYRNFAAVLGYKEVGRFDSFLNHFVNKDGTFKELKKKFEEKVESY